MCPRDITLCNDGKTYGMKLFRDSPFPDPPEPNDGLIPRKCYADMHLIKDLRYIGRPINHKPVRRRGQEAPHQEFRDSHQLFLFVC